MAKTIYGHRIGANIYEPDAPQGVKIVPDNKTLIALPFNDEPDDDIDPARLKSMKEIFEHYQPSREVVFDTSDGDSEEKILRFNSLKDFTREGIIAQSQSLQDLEEQEKVYSRLMDVLNNNERLINVLTDEQNKKELLELLETLIQELNESINE